jgi:hypothetical protein
MGSGPVDAIPASLLALPQSSNAVRSWGMARGVAGHGVRCGGEGHGANGDRARLGKGPWRSRRMSSQAATMGTFFLRRSAADWEPRPHRTDARS